MFVYFQCEPGPDSSLGEREMEAAFKLLTELKVSTRDVPKHTES